MAATFTPIEARPAPVKTEGLVPWVRKNLFGNPASSVATQLVNPTANWLNASSADRPIWPRSPRRPAEVSCSRASWMMVWVRRRVLATRRSSSSNRNGLGT